jgi:DNA adenine methylase
VSRPRPAASLGPQRLTHFTPLRYPGGKGKLASFIKELIETNKLSDGDYVEPYAGGAAIALELLLQGYVTHIHINDISRPVWAFWKAVLDHTAELVRLVRDTRLTVRAWDRQKAVITHQAEHDELTLGFAAFFLNRTNRSGILNAGVIGGRDQSGPWKIDARYNAPELIHRIESIAKLRRRISLSREDAAAFIQQRLTTLPKETLIYLDPPYYLKGKDLYYDYYTHEDHRKIAALVKKKIKRQKWIVSYDEVPAVCEMYQGCPRIVYELGYSAREVRHGTEVMFFSQGLIIPKLLGAMRPVAA